MKKIKLLLIGIISVLAFVGCNKPFAFPTESDFTLVSNVSNNTPKVGEEFEVNAIIQNSLESNYKIVHLPSVIGIYVVDLSEPERIIAKVSGPAITTNLKAKQKITKSHKLKLEKAGNYEIVVDADFLITNRKTNEQKTYLIKTEPIIIGVK